MEGYGLRPCKREHHLPWCPGICVEYICGEKGGNADLTCVLLTSEVQILTVGLYIHYENSNREKKKKKENWYLFKDLNPAWSTPLQCIAGKCQLKYLLGNAMYWDPFFSSPHPVQLQGDSVHKATTRSTTFVSILLCHTGEHFAKKPLETAKGCLKKQF